MHEADSHTELNSLVDSCAAGTAAPTKTSTHAPSSCCISTISAHHRNTIAIMSTEAAYNMRSSSTQLPGEMLLVLLYSAVALVATAQIYAALLLPHYPHVITWRVHTQKQRPAGSNFMPT